MQSEPLRYAALGSFDSYSLMLRFHDPADGPPESALARIATSTLSHELVHLAHTLGTAAGIRRFLMSVEDYQLRFAIASKYLRERGNADDFMLPIRVDINDDRVTNSGIGDELKLLADLRFTWDLYAGVERISLTGARSAAPFWLESDVRIRGRQIPWGVAHVNLYLFKGEDAALLPGYLQLTEGTAKIVERVQRRFAGEQGEASPQGTHRLADGKSFLREASSPFDPYYVAFMAFNSAKQRFAPDSPIGGYEEYVIILADMAMMIDPLTTPEATKTILGVSADTIETLKNGYSPFATYLRLCRIFWEQSWTLPQLGETDHMTEDVVRIQDALLAKVAPSLTMKDLTQELRSSFERYRDIFTAHIVDKEPGIADLFVNSFASALKFREEVLRGGAFCEDFLTSREKLETFARFLSPTYSVGSVVVSGYQTRPGFGVGVDQVNVEMFSDFLDAVIFGNRRCPLAGDQQTARMCVLDPVHLCERFPRDVEMSGEAYCVRGQAARLAGAFGLREMKWSLERS